LTIMLQLEGMTIFEYGSSHRRRLLGTAAYALISFYHISPKFGFAPPIFLTSLHPAVSETYWPVNHGSAKKVKGVGKGTDQSREPKAKLTYRKELTEQFGYAWSIATEKSDKSQSRRVTEE